MSDRPLGAEPGGAMDRARGSAPTEERPDARGTEVTCRDLATGESDTKIIRDDWMIVTDGACDVSHIQWYANGTAQITVRRASPEGRATEAAATLNETNRRSQ